MTHSDIFVRASGGSTTNLSDTTDGGNWDPDVSPDKEQIAFVSNRSGYNSIFVMNADGSGQTQLTNAGRSYM